MDEESTGAKKIGESWDRLVVLKQTGERISKHNGDIMAAQCKKVGFVQVVH